MSLLRREAPARSPPPRAPRAPLLLMAQTAAPLMLLLLLASTAGRASAFQPEVFAASIMPAGCTSEWQLVMCRDAPAGAARAACCEQHKRAPPHPQATAAAAAGTFAGMDAPRPDLETATGPGAAVGGAPPSPPAIDWKFDECTPRAYAEIPSFGRAPNGSTTVTIRRQLAPQLSNEAIANVKAAAMRRAQPQLIAMARASVARANAVRRPEEWRSGLLHPAGYAGAAELATMRARLDVGKPLQSTARTSLITVGSVVGDGGVAAAGKQCTLLFMYARTASKHTPLLIFLPPFSQTNSNNGNNNKNAGQGCTAQGRQRQVAPARRHAARQLLGALRDGARADGLGCASARRGPD